MAFNHVNNCDCPVGCCDCGSPGDVTLYSLDDPTNYYVSHDTVNHSTHEIKPVKGVKGLFSAESNRLNAQDRPHIKYGYKTQELAVEEAIKFAKERIDHEKKYIKELTRRWLTPKKKRK